ncbi:hypothetical protein [Flavobacterium tegetincola]|uniref:hypothetical protein n=1 Tax=Flavobacterium tegetincola TaxID=150172 RepID=UPI00040BD7CC|nr:hypothetical protein [Flavobacterium tegetincola]
MEVFIIQVIIFGIIFLTSYLGRKSLDITAVVISVFTIFAVFTSWLIILQFVTIVISYLFALDKMSLRKEQKIPAKNIVIPQNNSKSNNDRGCLTFTTLFIVVMGFLYAYNVWSVKNSNNKIASPTIIEENTFKTKVDSKNYDDYEYENNSDEDPTYYVDTVSHSNFQNFDTEEENNYFEDEYRYDDDYNDYRDASVNDEDTHHSKMKYGNFTFFQDINCEINNAQLRISKGGINQINFFLQVSNKYQMGEISGSAIISKDFQTAIFKSKDCESLIFYFLPNEQIHIKEFNCDNYHGTNICFNSVFY